MWKWKCYVSVYIILASTWTQFLADQFIQSKQFSGKSGINYSYIHLKENIIIIKTYAFSIMVVVMGYM